LAGGWWAKISAVEHIFDVEMPRSRTLENGLNKRNPTPAMAPVCRAAALADSAIAPTEAHDVWCGERPARGDDSGLVIDSI